MLRVIVSLGLLGVCFGFVMSAGTVSARSDTSSSPPPLGTPPPDWESVLASLPIPVATPALGTDPLALFVDPIGPALGLRDVAATLRTKKLPPALADELLIADLATTARQLVRHMVAWSLARASLDLTQRQETMSGDGRFKQIADQSAWLNATAENIPLVMPIAVTARALESSEVIDSDSLDEARYQIYANHLDRKYPLAPMGPDSWISLFETHGPAGWTARLADLPDGLTPSDREQASFAARYRSTRLRSLLRQRLQLLAGQLAVSSSAAVSAGWFNLHQWKDTVRERRGRARLCGSWQWTIHNHQNHGEQKLIVTFSPLGGAQSTGGPSEIIVLGDAVYLRWEVSGRIQEDSLLFSKEGQRLEGTFVNNAGGWGSITGKRAAPCVKQ